MFPEAIERRRQKFPEARYLSDWQVHSAHLVSGAIKFTCIGVYEGPLYVPMPTGSGKTTGAIWGIVELCEEYPDARICFFTPYIEAVKEIYDKLVVYLGADKVGHYHFNGAEPKFEALRKQVVVLTHQFLSNNPAELLNDRDVFIVDEAIYATGEATLKLSDIAKAREWAETNNVMPGDFVKLSDYANQLDQKLRQEGKKHVAGDKPDDLDWVKNIAHNLKLSDYSQTMDDMTLISAMVRLCESLLAGMVFVSKGTTNESAFNPTFSAAVFGIPKINKTVVLSATGGLLYSIAGQFKQDMGSREYWSPPIYDNLTLTQLSGPKLPSTYNHWNNDKTKTIMVAYLDWLLQEIPEQTIYLTMPKKIVDQCLRHYFGQLERGDVTYPFEVKKHDKTIHVSHHAVSIGTNKFKDCDAVVYLWDNHLPASVAVQRYHILSEEPITDDSLEDANKSRLLGNYERIRDAQYLDNMMQHIGRGNVRNISDDQQVGKMTAYVLSRTQDSFTRLATQYRGCQIKNLEYPNQEVSVAPTRIGRILDYLIRYGNGEDVLATDMEEYLGFSVRRYSDALEDSYELICLGYSFQRGKRGRSIGGVFVYMPRPNSTTQNG